MLSSPALAGWNLPYSWMPSDLAFAQANLKIFLNKQSAVPWEVLSFMIADVIYGGRVTDKQDVRLIRGMLSQCLHPDALEKPGTHSYCPPSSLFNERSRYRAPPEGDKESYLAFIATLPLNAPPEVVGLHQNADIVAGLDASREFIEAAISLQGRVVAVGGDGGVGGTRPDETIVCELVEDLERQLPAPLDRMKAGEGALARVGDPSTSALGVFLAQEVLKFNKFLDVITKQLRDLHRAVNGLVVMSADLDKVFANLLRQQVPAQWREKSAANPAGTGYPSTKPLGPWFRDFLLRMECLSGWLHRGPPRSFWLSCFFFPQGFLTAVNALPSCLLSTLHVLLIAL